MVVVQSGPGGARVGSGGSNSAAGDSSWFGSPSTLLAQGGAGAPAAIVKKKGLLACGEVCLYLLQKNVA